jgi:hypothetical protein
MDNKISTLMKNMGAYRHILVEILGFCEKPRSAEEIDVLLEPLLKHRKSVYTPIGFRDMLKKAGGLEYIVADPEDDEAISSPGSFLVVKEKPDGVWLTTPHAHQYLEEQTPQPALTQLLEDEPDLMPLFLRILEFCAEQGRTASELASLVDDDPLVQNPRRMSGYFVAGLEDTKALSWEGVWATTALGLAALGQAVDSTLDVSKSARQSSARERTVANG